MHPLLRRTALILGLAFAAAAVHADELQDISRMMRQGQLPQSLERVDKYLSGKPRDAQGRFLKGLILTEMNRASEAIQVFQKLSEDYPELPEPYNNLAVLYASQGQYEKARTALESSIRTHPSYATAHENLGDIYAKLASQAYDKALQLDSSNTGAKTKLAMIGDLIGGGARTARAPARTEPVKTGEAAPAKAPEAAPPKAADTVKATTVAEAKPGAEPSATAAAKVAAPKAGAGTESDALLKTVRAWASAWARKDVPGYLAHYAKDLRRPKENRAATGRKGERPESLRRRKSKSKSSRPKSVSAATKPQA